MNGRKVINPAQLPARLPVMSTLVLWLTLDQTHAAGWVWGVVGTVLAVVWIGVTIDIYTRQVVNLKELDK